MTTGISFVIPAYNEERAIASTATRVKAALCATGLPHEIIVVDDGSTDRTRDAIAANDGIRLIRHPVNTGYGSAIKSGIRAAQYDWIGIVDADDTYEIEALPELARALADGFDMAVGHRGNVFELDRPVKRLLRRVLIGLLNLTIAAQIKDPNSGFRLFRKELASTFFPFLCNTFSFTTSLTLFALGEGYFVKYVPVQYSRRTGRSKVRKFRDALRMAQLILQGIIFFNPLKFYLALNLLLAVFIAVPALALAFLGQTTAAFIVAMVGGIASLLIGLGVLADIVRISTTLRVRKKENLLEP